MSPSACGPRAITAATLLRTASSWTRSMSRACSSSASAPSRPGLRQLASLPPRGTARLAWVPVCVCGAAPRESSSTSSSEPARPTLVAGGSRSTLPWVGRSQAVARVRRSKSRRPGACAVSSCSPSSRWRLARGSRRLPEAGGGGARGAPPLHETRGSGFLAPHDVSFPVEVERDRRHVEVRADLLGYPMLAPVLVLAAGSVEPEDHQIGIELSQRIGDRGDLVLCSDFSVGFQAAGVHVREDRPQPFVRGGECVISVVGQP